MVEVNATILRTGVAVVTARVGVLTYQLQPYIFDRKFLNFYGLLAAFNVEQSFNIFSLADTFTSQYHGCNVQITLNIAGDG